MNPALECPAAETAPHLAAPFAVELGVTEAHRRLAAAHPALREAACLRAMFPAALSPIEAHDRFAGRFLSTPGVDRVRKGWDPLRHNIPAIGFLPLAPGSGHSAGYFCHEGILERKIAAHAPSDSLRAELEAARLYWREHSVPARCRQAYPASINRHLPHDSLDGLAHAWPAFPLVRMTGPMYDNARLVELGLPGLHAAVDRSRARSGGDPDFFHGLHEALDLCADVAEHCAAQALALAGTIADPARAADLRQQADLLRRLRHRAPDSFREGAQLVFLFGVLGGAYSWGRLDDALGPLLARDLDAGVLTEPEALDLLCSLWTLINDNGAPFDNRVIIGGRGRRHVAAADRFARLAIEATRRTRLPLPQLSLRFHPEQAPDLHEQALACIGEGRTFPILYNDDVNIPATAHAMGVSLREAEQYVPYGCGEYVLHGSSFGTPSDVFNHTKVLECLIRNGTEPVSGQPCGPALGPLRDFKTFDALYDAYLAALDFWIGLMAEQQKIEYEVVGRECAYLFWSLLYDDCLERGQPLFSGGIRHLAGTLESYGQINASDSLYALRRALYEDRRVDADTLLRALDNNFEGHEDLRAYLEGLPKYGNDDPGADAMAVALHEATCAKTREQARRVGLASYLIVIINNMCNTVLGGHTLASPDGRRAFEPLANANNPAPGHDRAGLTAMLNSLVKLRCDLHAGAVQNLKLAPEFFHARLPELKALLSVYFRRGAQLMITVVNAGDLEAALREPGKWGHLMVRVGGFSARFVDLPPAVQREVLARTLNA